MPIHLELGEELIGEDLSNPLSQDKLDYFMDLYNRYHLLIFRNQTLSEEAFISFSRYFSTPIAGILPQHRHTKFPLISVASNIQDEHGNPTGSMIPDYFWHSDGYFLDNPHKATLLYAKVVPTLGGETFFIDMAAVYDSLSVHLKEKVDTLRVVYKNAYLNRPPVTHPMVRTNPVTGRKALFVNIFKAIQVEGMSKEDSQKFLQDLYDYATHSPSIYKHKWQLGDLAVWNNPSTMHLATYPLDNQPRVLYRIVTEGTLPVC